MDWMSRMERGEDVSAERGTDHMAAAESAARHETVYAQTNPETGRKAYPATTPDGYPVRANGSVEGCDCERCEDRRDLDMETDESQPTADANYCLGTERCPDCGTLVEIWDNQRGDYTLRLDITTRGGQEHSC